MTKSTFERKHPGFGVQVLHVRGTGVTAWATAPGWFLFERGRTEGEAVLRLSNKLLAMKARRVAREQGWRDANTGEVGPLQAHHVTPRSQGGSHDERNLAGVRPETHSVQHRRKL